MTDKQNVLKRHLKSFNITPKSRTTDVMCRSRWRAMPHTDHDTDTEKHLKVTNLRRHGVKTWPCKMSCLTRQNLTTQKQAECGQSQLAMCHIDRWNCIHHKICVLSNTMKQAILKLRVLFFCRVQFALYIAKINLQVEGQCIMYQCYNNW